MYTFKEIKAYLQTQTPLTFKGITKSDTGGLTSFLENILVYNNSYDTIYKNGVVQTSKGKRRSIGDLFRIAHAYFPNVKLTTIYKALLTLIVSKKALSAICKETGLRVYRATKSGDVACFNGEAIDEFYVDFKKFEEYEKTQQLEGWWGFDFGKAEIKFVKI